MKLLRILTLCIAISFITSCNQSSVSDTGKQAPQEWKTLHENGYSLQCPPNWSLDKSGQSGTSFIVLSQQESPDDNFRENVNLLIQDLSGLNIDLDKYTEISLDQVRTMLTKGKIMESVEKNARGLSYQKVVYTGVQGIYEIYCQQYYWVRENKAYVLTLTCETDKVKMYKETGEMILNSFKFDNI